MASLRITIRFIEEVEANGPARTLDGPRIDAFSAGADDVIWGEISTLSVGERAESAGQDGQFHHETSRVYTAKRKPRGWSNFLTKARIFDRR